MRAIRSQRTCEGATNQCQEPLEHQETLGHRRIQRLQAPLDSLEHLALLAHPTIQAILVSHLTNANVNLNKLHEKRTKDLFPESQKGHSLPESRPILESPPFLRPLVVLTLLAFQAFRRNPAFQECLRLQKCLNVYHANYTYELKKCHYIKFYLQCHVNQECLDFLPALDYRLKNVLR